MQGYKDRTKPKSLDSFVTFIDVFSDLGARN